MDPMLKLTKGGGCILKEGDEVVLSFSELGACMRIRFTVKASLLLNTYICMHACSFKFCKRLSFSCQKPEHFLLVH